MSQACSACHNESETVKLLCIECQGVNCTNCTKRVENAVLAYCQQFQESFNVDEMANALYVHFSEEDILKARQLLRDSCSGLLMNHIIMTVGCRRGTDARPAAEVSAMDIASAMYSIVDSEDVPKFIVLDLNQLPILKPTVTNAQYATSQRLLMLENMLKRMCERTQIAEEKIADCSNSIEVNKNRTEILNNGMRKIQNDVDTQARLLSEFHNKTAVMQHQTQQQQLSRPQYAQIAQVQTSPILQRPPVTPQPMRMMQPAGPGLQPGATPWIPQARPIGPGAAVTPPQYRLPNPGQQMTQPAQITQAVQQQQQQQVNNLTNMTQAVSANTQNGSLTGTQTFSTAPNGINGRQMLDQDRPPSRNQWRQQGRPKRQQGIKGSVEGTNFKAGPSPNRDLWVFNVDHSIDDDDLRHYIAQGGNKKSKAIEIRKWDPRYKDHYSSKCFRLTIGLDDYKTVYSSEFWPKDIGVRKYWVNPNDDE